MVCEKCNIEFNGNFCPDCGQKAESKLFSDLKRFVYDDSENIVAVLGNNIAQSFISTGALEKGFAFLTDKRVYFRGECLIRKGKGFYTKTEEKSVDIKDITGTGFAYNNAVWAKIWRFITLAQAALTSIIFAIMVMAGVITFVDFPINAAVVGFFWAVHILFFFLNKRYNYSAFEISYAGGGIAFDMHWINEAESHEFQKNLNLLKDKLKSTAITTDISQHKIKTASVPEQLKQYKELLDSGVLTQEEFDAKKKELLQL